MAESCERDGSTLPAVFISADWSKKTEKRSVHVADLGQRRIWREDRGDWNLRTLLDLARNLACRGPVLLGLDLALGVPAGYWSEVLTVPHWRGSDSFLGWLRKLEPPCELRSYVALPQPQPVLLAKRHARSKRYVEAEEVLREAIRLAPESSEAHLNLGVSLEHQDRKREAEDALAKGRQLASRLADA